MLISRRDSRNLETAEASTATVDGLRQEYQKLGMADPSPLAHNGLLASKFRHQTAAVSRP